MSEEKTKAPDYEQMTHEDLTKIARERGVENIEAHRKADFRKLLKAQDDGNEKAIAEVKATVLERIARTDAANAPAQRVMEKAKANAGVAMSAMPKTDSAKVKQGAAVEAAKHVHEQKQEAQKPVAPKIDTSAAGSDIVRQIQERSAALREGALQSKMKPKRSIAAALLAMVGTGATVAEQPVFEVLEDCSYFSRHGVYKLAKGSLVTANTHDMDSLRANGAKLREIDHSKTRIVYSELGHPLRLETVAADSKEE